MRNRQYRGGQVALIVLSLLGAGIAIYLTAVHYQNVPLVCSSQGLINCERVISSPYSLVPGTAIPITVPGLTWCVVNLGLALVGLRFLAESYGVRVAQFVWALLGMLTVLYLVYVEIVRLHTICAWCTAMHLIILITFLITLFQLQRPEAEEELEPEQTPATMRH